MIGIINKFEIYNGCIFVDLVGLGKMFIVLVVVKYYELWNWLVFILCLKKFVDNWWNYNINFIINIFV